MGEAVSTTECGSPSPLSQEALQLCRDNTLLSLMLVHIHMVAGRWQQALAVADAAAKAAPADADAQVCGEGLTEKSTIMHYF